MSAIVTFKTSLLTLSVFTENSTMGPMVDPEGIEQKSWRCQCAVGQVWKALLVVKRLFLPGSLVRPDKPYWREATFLVGYFFHCLLFEQQSNDFCYTRIF